MLALTGCGSSFEASGSDAGGDDAGGSANAAMKPESVAGRSGSAGASPASITDGGASSAGGGGSAGSAGAVTGHENCFVVADSAMSCVLKNMGTFYGPCTAPCVPAGRPDVAVWCCAP